jgi:hypothetical protein
VLTQNWELWPEDTRNAIEIMRDFRVTLPISTNAFAIAIQLVIYIGADVVIDCIETIDREMKKDGYG